MTMGPRVSLKGVNGYNNGVGTLDAICAGLYESQNLPECRVRSLKLWDFQFANSSTLAVKTMTLNKSRLMPATCANIDAKGNMYIESLQPSKQISTVSSSLKVNTDYDYGDVPTSLQATMLYGLFIGVTQPVWLSTRCDNNGPSERYGLLTAKKETNKGFNFVENYLCEIVDGNSIGWLTFERPVVAIMEVPKNLYEVLNGKIVRK